ncbi:MAG: metallophosphoesterase, partial [Pseudomonadota bacterium]
MNEHEFSLAGATLTARASGALFWAASSMLVVSDLHLGKSDRIARRSGAMLPPYET